METGTLNEPESGLKTHTPVGMATLGEIMLWLDKGTKIDDVAARVGMTRPTLEAHLDALGLKWNVEQTHRRWLSVKATGEPLKLEGYVRGV